MRVLADCASMCSWRQIVNLISARGTRRAAFLEEIKKYVKSSVKFSSYLRSVLRTGDSYRHAHCTQLKLMVIEDAMQNLVAIPHKDPENEQVKGRRPPLFYGSALLQSAPALVLLFELKSCSSCSTSYVCGLESSVSLPRRKPGWRFTACPKF